MLCSWVDGIFKWLMADIKSGLDMVDNEHQSKVGLWIPIGCSVVGVLNHRLEMCCYLVVDLHAVCEEGGGVELKCIEINEWFVLA